MLYVQQNGQTRWGVRRMGVRLAVVAVLAVLLLAGGAAADASWTATVNGTEVTVTYEGSGTEGDPYLINGTNAEMLAELQAINHNSSTRESTYYKLTSDIDASATANWNGGDGFVPIGQTLNGFGRGGFDGSNKTISNLYINTSSNNAGLFGKVFDSEIYDLSLTNTNIQGNNNVGGIAGLLERPKPNLDNLSVAGDISGPSLPTAGGVIGKADTASVRVDGWHFSGNVTGFNAGGLAGNGASLEVHNASVDAVLIEGGANGDVGGIFGDAQNGASVTNAYVEVADLRQSGSGSGKVHAIAGSGASTVTSTYVIANTTAGNLRTSLSATDSYYLNGTQGYAGLSALSRANMTGIAAVDAMDFDWGDTWRVTDSFPELVAFSDGSEPAAVIIDAQQLTDPSTADAGTTVSVSVPINNAGGTEGSDEITLSKSDGTQLDAQNVTVAVNTPQTITLNWSSAPTDFGSHTLTVASGAQTRTVSVTLNRVNIPPEATNRTVELVQDTTATGNITDDVSDADNDTLLVNTTPVRGPLSNATLEITSSGAWSYTPPTGYTGNDSFAYNVSDQNGSFTIGEVAFTITAPAPSGGSGGGGSTGGAAAVTTGGSAGADGTDGAGAEAGVSTVTTIAGTAPEVRLGSGTDPTGTPLVAVGFRSETPLTTRLGVGSLRSMTQLPDDGAFVAAADIRFPADTDTDAIDEIRMTLHTASVAARGHDVDALAIYHLDAETDTWTRLETARTTDGAHTVLTAQPVGFSVYGVFAADAAAVPATPAPTPTADPGTPTPTPTPTPAPAAENIQPADPALLVGAVGVAVLILLAVLFGRRE